MDDPADYTEQCKCGGTFRQSEHYPMTVTCDVCSDNFPMPSIAFRDDYTPAITVRNPNLTVYEQRILDRFWRKAS